MAAQEYYNSFPNQAGGSHQAPTYPPNVSPQYQSYTQTPPQTMNPAASQYNLADHKPNYPQRPPQQQPQRPYNPTQYSQPPPQAQTQYLQPPRIQSERSYSEPPRHHHDHRHHSRPRSPSPSRSRSRSRDRGFSPSRSRHRSRARTQNKEASNTSTFLGAFGGGAIGDAIFPGLGTLGGALLGGWGGHSVGRSRSGGSSGRTGRKRDRYDEEWDEGRRRRGEIP